MYREISIEKKRGWQDFFEMGLGLAVLTMVPLVASDLKAETFPDRPMQLIVPSGAGAGTDLFVRGIQPYAEKYLGVRLIIQNIPGADTRIGMTKLHKSKPDGFTIGSTPYPTPIVSELFFNPPYKALDFSFIYAWGMNATLLFVSENSSWKSFDDFILEAHKRPLAVGLPGLGTAVHLLALTMEKHMNVKCKYVSYPNTAEGYTAVAGNHIDAMIGGTDAALGLVRAKKMRPILAWSSQPDYIFPDVPLSTNYKMPAFALTRGVFGPPNMPEGRVRTLERAFSQAAAEPKFEDWMKSRGINRISLNAKQYRQQLENEQLAVREYKDLLKASVNN